MSKGTQKTKGLLRTKQLLKLKVGHLMCCQMKRLITLGPHGGYGGSDGKRGREGQCSVDRGKEERNGTGVAEWKE